jgi:uncharacterized membrane protein YadS
VTFVAALLQGVKMRLARHAYLKALVLAILLGVALRTLWTPGRAFGFIRLLHVT